MKLRIALIVAMTPDRVIGIDGKLPWKLPADLRHFKETTMGCPVIMGRRTWESIGKPLRGRMNIVLTSKAGYEVPGGQVAHSTKQALGLAQRHIIERLAASFESPSVEVQEPLVMVIGGEAVYRAFMPVAERIYQTLVHTDIPGDTFFPHMDASAWTETDRQDHPADEDNPYPYSFIVLERKVAQPQAVHSNATLKQAEEPRERP